MFTRRVMVIKINVKNGSFFVFSADGSKKLVPERSYWVFSENFRINRLESCRPWDIDWLIDIRKTAELSKNIEILYFQGLTSC